MGLCMLLLGTYFFIMENVRIDCHEPEALPLEVRMLNIRLISTASDLFRSAVELHRIDR